MKTKLIVLVLAAAALWWWQRSPARGPTPDADLARHLDGLCDIAGDHVDEPERGVDLVFAYLGKHTPTMMKKLGETFVVIERIGDDRAHDRRARAARKRLHASGHRCQPKLERFFQAVEDDPAACAKFQRGVERFGRTVEIIFGNDAGALASTLPSPACVH